MGTVGSLPGGDAAGRVKLTIRMAELYLHSPIRRHGVLLKLVKHMDSFSFYRSYRMQVDVTSSGIGKDEECSSRGSLVGTVPAFSWRVRGKLREVPSHERRSTERDFSDAEQDREVL
jgi:hypothetical protein